MKRVYVVCKRCGYAEKQEIYEQEEAIRKNLRLVPPRYNKCGSMEIEFNG